MRIHFGSSRRRHRRYGYRYSFAPTREFEENATAFQRAVKLIIRLIIRLGALVILGIFVMEFLGFYVMENDFYPQFFGIIFVTGFSLMIIDYCISLSVYENTDHPTHFSEEIGDI